MIAFLDPEPAAAVLVGKAMPRRGSTCHVCKRWLAERATQPFFAIREPRHHVLQRLPYDRCAAEVSTVQLEN
jgi:hypothetical protein